MTATDSPLARPVFMTEVEVGADGDERVPRAGRAGAGTLVTPAALEAWERSSYWLELSRPASGARLRLSVVDADALLKQELPEQTVQALVPATAGIGILLAQVRPFSSLPAREPTARELESAAAQVAGDEPLHERAWRVRLGHAGEVDAEWFVLPGAVAWLTVEPLSDDEVGLVVAPLNVRSALLRVVSHLQSRR